MFKVKSVPKWAWYAGGGAALVGIILALRARGGQVPAATAADQAGVTGYTDTSQMPGVIVVPQSPGASGDVTGDIGTSPDYTQTFLDAFSGLLDSQGQQIQDLLGIVANGGGTGGTVGSTDQTGGVVTVASPPAKQGPSPAANPCVGMEAGSTAGACKPSGAICRQMVKCDSNSNGHYCTWRFKFADGHTECYNNYSSGKNAGKCVGPFGCP